MRECHSYILYVVLIHTQVRNHIMTEAITESQNGQGWNSPILLLQQDPLDHVTQDCVQMVF